MPKIYRKIIFFLCLFAFLLGVVASGQSLVSLQHDTNANRTLTIDASGHFEFRTEGPGSLRAEGDGAMMRFGCFVFLKKETTEYSITAQANSCNQTGNATLNYFSRGKFPLLDNTAN